MRWLALLVVLYLADACLHAATPLEQLDKVTDFVSSPEKSRVNVRIYPSSVTWLNGVRQPNTADESYLSLGAGDSLETYPWVYFSRNYSRLYRLRLDRIEGRYAVFTLSTYAAVPYKNGYRKESLLTTEVIRVVPVICWVACALY